MPPADPWAGFVEVRPPSAAGAGDPWAGFHDVTPPGYLKGAESIGATPWYDQGIGGLVGMQGRGPSVRDALNLLPTAGGAAGGIIGGAGGTVAGMAVGGVPGAVGGAALGGAAGEAARQQIGDVIGIPKPQTAMERAKGIGTQAAIQGAAELGGQGLAVGAKALGRGMVENAVRPSMSLQREFPGVVDTIIKERLPVGAGIIPGSAKGSEHAAALLGEKSVAVKALLAKATAGGKTFETSKLAEPVLKLLDDIAEQPLSKGDMARLDTMLEEFTNKKGPLSPLDVQKLKQKAQAIAKPIYKAVARGEAVSADQSLLARFNSAIATGAKQAMETIPGVAEGEAKKRALIGAERALSDAEKRRLSLMAEGVSSSASIVSALLSKDGGLDDSLRNGVIAFALTRGVMSPRSLSRTGLALTSTQAQVLIRQFPRLGLAVISAAQGGAGRPAIEAP